jgi:transcription elongation factor Elf1
MKNKCPNCGKPNCVSSCAINNAEIYGSQIAKVNCKHCQAPLSVTLIRKVTIENILIGNFTTDDWGEPSNPIKVFTDPNDSDTVTESKQV